MDGVRIREKVITIQLLGPAAGNHSLIILFTHITGHAFKYRVRYTNKAYNRDDFKQHSRLERRWGILSLFGVIIASFIGL
jgi:hypothetical protein